MPATHSPFLETIEAAAEAMTRRLDNDRDGDTAAHVAHNATGSGHGHHARSLAQRWQRLVTVAAVHEAGVETRLDLLEACDDGVDTRAVRGRCDAVTMRH